MRSVGDLLIDADVTERQSAIYLHRDRRPGN
jgi:hypothetical protein